MAKHAGGRPPKFTEPKEMENRIEVYFKACEERDKPKTIAGLSMACGFTSRHTLIEYEKKEGFSHIIKKARLVVEDEVESRLFGNNCTGSIFWLKNHGGYKDRTETELTGKDGAPIETLTEVVIRPQITREEWLAIHGMDTATRATISRT